MALGIVLAAVYVVNAAAIIGGTPIAESPLKLSGERGSSLADWQREHPGVPVTIAAVVSPTSWLKLPSTGTVSVLGDDRIFVNDPALHGEWPMSYVLDHELHHVQQIDLVESVAWSEPSFWNPAGTASHFLVLERLSAVLNELYGEPRFSDLGAERASDCYAVWLARSTAGDAGPAYGPASSCTPTQVAASIAIADGVWPSESEIQTRMPQATDVLATKLGNTDRG